MILGIGLATTQQSWNILWFVRVCAVSNFSKTIDVNSWLILKVHLSKTIFLAETFTFKTVRWTFDISYTTTNLMNLFRDLNSVLSDRVFKWMLQCHYVITLFIEGIFTFVALFIVVLKLHLRVTSSVSWCCSFLPVPLQW